MSRFVDFTLDYVYDTIQTSLLSTCKYDFGADCIIAHRLEARELSTDLVRQDLTFKNVLIAQ
jgi:hypothetical protein